jgi:alkylhydroperoxidase family enzyme
MCLLAERFLDPQTVSELAGGGAAGLDEAETAIMDFAAKVARDACSITEDDVQRLREAGLSDHDIFDVNVAASARCFFSKTLDAVGALPDAEYAELDPGLRDALTVGRPIEQRPSA